MTSFLEKHKRHPKLYIDLPSQGRFYDDTVANKVEHIPVFGMSAMDEIILKTPDALFSGEATAQVIKSCIPDILDPWQLVGYDIDYVLVAIRIATYGESIDVNTTCKNCKTSTASSVQLTRLLELLNSNELVHSFDMNGLTFHINPITYKFTTDFSIESYTIERQILDVPNLDIEQKEKDRILNNLYTQAAELNLKLAISHIAEITSGDEREDNKQAIFEFVQENDVEFYNNLKNTITKISGNWSLPAFDVECSNEECNETYKTAVDMDYANFFGTRSLRSRNLISDS